MGKSTEPLKTRQYVTAETLTGHLQDDTGHATLNLLTINVLTIFRVRKTPTLKTVKRLFHSDLQVTQIVTATRGDDYTILYDCIL